MWRMIITDNSSKIGDTQLIVNNSKQVVFSDYTSGFDKNFTASIISLNFHLLLENYIAWIFWSK